MTVEHEGGGEVGDGREQGNDVREGEGGHRWGNDVKVDGGGQRQGNDVRSVRVSEGMWHDDWCPPATWPDQIHQHQEEEK